MNPCTTATLYTCFKTAIGAASTAIGATVLDAAGNEGYSTIKEVAAASSLGGAILGIADYALQVPIFYYAIPNEVCQPMTSIFSAVSFLASHVGSGILGLKLLSFSLDSIFSKIPYQTMIECTGVGSLILGGSAGLVLCVYILCSRNNVSAEIASAENAKAKEVPRAEQTEVYSNRPVL